MIADPPQYQGQGLATEAARALYHFFAPWNCVAIFLVFLPLAYYVRLRGNLLPAIITHCLFNSVGIVIALAGLL